jgi:hypothetical protein
MREMLIALVIFVCLASASIGSLFAYGRLPARYRDDDTQTIVRLVATLFVVMTSLVLGLMINSAKNRFEAIDRDLHAFATNLILLDRMMREYGPETNEAHQRLIAYMQRASRRASSGKWLGEDELIASDQSSERLLNEVGDRLWALPASDAQRLEMKNDVRQQFRTAVTLRWNLVERSEGAIPMPLLGMVVAWLVLIFANFGFRAPRNPVIVVTFLTSAALLAGALYLILDMDSPFAGPIQISPAPLQRALVEIQR